MKGALTIILLFGFAVVAVAVVPPALFLLHRATDMPHHLTLSTKVAELALATSLGIAALTLAVVTRAIQKWWAMRGIVRTLPVTASEVEGAAVQLFVSSKSIAFASGLRRPRIYLSTGALQHLSPGQLRAALLHERAHLEYSDTRTVFVLALSRALLGRMPVADAFICREQSRLELRADSRAIELGANRADLFDAIVRCSPSPEPSVTGAGTHERLRALASNDCRPQGEAPNLVVSAATLTVLGTPVLVAIAAYAWLCGMQPW